jgi:hypothetical protein
MNKMWILILASEFVFGTSLKIMQNPFSSQEGGFLACHSRSNYKCWKKGGHSTGGGGGGEKCADAPGNAVCESLKTTLDNSDDDNFMMAFQHGMQVCGDLESEKTCCATCERAYSLMEQSCGQELALLETVPRQICEGTIDSVTPAAQSTFCSECSDSACTEAKWQVLQMTMHVTNPNMNPQCMPILQGFFWHYSQSP